MIFCDHSLGWTIWIWFVAIIRSPEQSGYEFLRSFARLNNLDMICCDHSLDRTIWIWFVAIIRSTEHRDMNFGQKLVQQHRFFFFVFVLAWGHYWIIFGYIGGHFCNIRCCFRQLLKIGKKSAENILKNGFFELARLKNRWNMGLGLENVKSHIYFLPELRESIYTPDPPHSGH